MDDQEAAARHDCEARRERVLEEGEQNKTSGECYTDNLATQEPRRLVLQSDTDDQHSYSARAHSERKHDDVDGDSGEEGTYGSDKHDGKDGDSAGEGSYGEDERGDGESDSACVGPYREDGHSDDDRDSAGERSYVADEHSYEDQESDNAGSNSEEQQDGDGRVTAGGRSFGEGAEMDGERFYGEKGMTAGIASYSAGQRGDQGWETGSKGFNREGELDGEDRETGGEGEQDDCYSDVGSHTGGDFGSNGRRVFAVRRTGAAPRNWSFSVDAFTIPRRRILAMVGLSAAALLAYLLAAHSVPLEHRLLGIASTSPPWYPTPQGGTVKSWEEAYRKAAELVSQMTLTEKVNVTTGTGWQMGPCVGNTGAVPRLGFPSICLQDAPLGVRFGGKITSFPAGITTGGTWDKDLIRQRGEAIAAEFRGKGVNVALGPAMGALGKHPAGGRNWEGFGSDPYLQGVASYETIIGIQSQGVIATAKHFIANEQEHFRQGPSAISSNLDDRTLHEVYLWPFQDSVKAGVGAVMCSYNRVNNSAACQNSWLQNNILKDQLGFQGFIMSDWLAQMSGVGSVLAGLDMSMPGDGYAWDDRVPMLGPRLSEAVLNSSVPIQRLNDMVTRIVATWYQLGQDSAYPAPNFSSWTQKDIGNIYWGSYEAPVGLINQHVDVMAGHPALARKIAAEAIALLKNERSTLPLKKPMKIGVYGEDAALPAGGPNTCADRGCNVGTLAVGWGSGTTDFVYLVDPLSAITEKAKSYGGVVTAITQNNLTSEIAASAAKQDVCLVFVNADSGEAYFAWGDVAGDRNNLETQNGGDSLVLAVANACGKTIVVAHSVGPIILEKWVTKRQVRSIVWAHLPGMESGNSLVDVLWGAVNPSGKLPYTIGKSLADYGAAAGIVYADNTDLPQSDFTDGIFVDYRHFDQQKITPRFEFGFGLSYTTFSYSHLTKTKKGNITALPAVRPRPTAKPPVYSMTIPDQISALFPESFTKIKRFIYPYLEETNVTVGDYPYPEGYSTLNTPSQAGGGEGGNPALWEVLVRVSATVTNTGHVAGAEIAQLYLVFPQSAPIPFPPKTLRGFEKVFLQPGQSKEVTFDLTRRDLSYWDVVRQNWVIPTPGIGVNVGASSRKIKAQGYISTI